MRIGKYDVTPGGDGYPGRKEFTGHALLTWDQGDSTFEKMLRFEKTFPTLDEATQHAIDQVRLRVENGEL